MKKCEVCGAEKVEKKWEEQAGELAREASHYDSAGLYWDGEEFWLDPGNPEVHLTRDYHSPCLNVTFLRAISDTHLEDDEWSLLYLLEEKTGKFRDIEEVREMVQDEGSVSEVCEKYDIDYNEVIRRSAEAEMEDFFSDNGGEEILDIAKEIEKEIENWKGR